MQRYTQIKAAAAEDDLALALVADAELFRLEAIVRWLDAADARLKQLPAPGAGRGWPTLPLEPTRTAGGLAMTSALELRAGVEGLRLRADRGARAARGRPVGRARRARGGHGSERLGQEHAA